MCKVLAKPMSKKLITVDKLKVMVKGTNGHLTLLNVKLTTACHLAFAGFLHFNELVNV